jgi:predicted transcriptional regulator
METKVDFIKIKEQLPHGAQTDIAKRANVHLHTVTRVLNGESENVAVLNAIADYLTERKNEKQNANNRLSSLID